MHSLPLLFSSIYKVCHIEYSYKFNEYVFENQMNVLALTEATSCGQGLNANNLRLRR
jgi:hypothetical protein